MNFDHKTLSSNNSWPFVEAKRVLKRIENSFTKKEFVAFQTGYGPSGLPHIGTFGEVVRTTMVKRAFEELCDIPTKLICFSDDLDGLRKVPNNVPNPEELTEDLDLPLTVVRDPFGEAKSFGMYNNNKLREFLDQYNFDYQFVSATNTYQEGTFDDGLIRVLENYEKIMDLILPSLRKERQQTYSPFLPISPKSGKVLQVPLQSINKSAGTIVYKEPDGEKVEISVKTGRVKLQWKPDWAMRWLVLGIDYEMFGKDLIPSAELASKICRVIGGNPPELLNYELFLDERGQKISKSKGNGLSIEEWLRYASQESLSYFMFQKPKTAKRLFFDVIPKMMDEYHQSLNSYENQTHDQKLQNPVWHIHPGPPPRSDMLISFSMLLNLVVASGSEDETTLWGFIDRYAPNIEKDNHPSLKEAVTYAIRYYKDFVKPKKKFRSANEKERKALLDLHSRLEKIGNSAGKEELQSLVYSVGKEHNFEQLKDWFTSIYEILLGTSTGPRLGGFISLYGVEETRDLISAKLAQ